MNVNFNVYASLLSATPDDVSNVASWLADREAAKEAEKMVVDETVQDSVCMSSESVWYDKKIGMFLVKLNATGVVASTRSQAGGCDRWH